MKTSPCVGMIYNLLNLATLSLLGLSSVASAGSWEGPFLDKLQSLKSATTQILGKGLFKEPTESWPTFRKGSSNQAISSLNASHLVTHYRSKNRSPSLFDTQGLIWATAITDESGNLYVGSANREFYSLTPTGEKRWSFKLHPVADSLIDSSAALVPGTELVVVPGGDGFLHARNRNTGEFVWEFEAQGVSSETHQSGTIVNSFEGHVQVGPGPNGLIYAGSDNGTMYALNRSGKLVWSLKTGMMIWSTPVFDSRGRWMAFGSLDGNLYLVDPANGDQLATFPCKADIKSSPTTDGRGNLFFGNSNGELISLQVVEAADHSFSLRKNWSFQTEREVYSSPTVKNGKVFFGSVDGNFYALQAQTGHLIWKYSTYVHILSSPMITQDHVVIFGAKNGKVYALNSETGERIWSYRTTSEPSKSNLDSSVMMDAEGILHVGSYNGNLYHIPYEYCLTHPEDTDRCEFKGKQDLPDFVPAEHTQLATLRWIPGQESRTFDPSTVLQLRLVVFQNGEFIENAAIDARSSRLRVEVTTRSDSRSLVPVKAEVSSDGKFLNITAQGFFTPDQEYQIKVSGLYYLQSKNFFYDRLSNLNPFNEWINEKPFEATETFKIQPSSGSPLDSLNHDDSITWGLKSLYLLQPEALDTYLPAALDGQGFFVTAFGFNRKTHRMMILGLPAVPARTSDESFILQTEPSKVFTLNGKFQNDSIQGVGSFTLAGMGGVIPFSSFSFSGTLKPESLDLKGTLNAKSYCPSVKGNGASYSFPFSLINQVCDPWLNVIAVGTFQGMRLPAPLSMPKVLSFQNTTGKEASAVLHFSEASGTHLLTVIQYDSKKQEVVFQNTQVLELGEHPSDQTWMGKVPLKTNCWGCCQRGSKATALFFDGHLLDLSSAEACPPSPRK